MMSGLSKSEEAGHSSAIDQAGTSEGGGSRSVRDSTRPPVQSTEATHRNKTTKKEKTTTTTVAAMTPPAAVAATVHEGNVAATNGHCERSSRVCCFRWCCCYRCPCSRMPVQEDNSQKPEHKLENLNGSGEPTIEDIRTWGESFDKLMKCSAGRQIFRDFLKCEYSEENILFWLACEDLKRECDPERVEEKARLIYEDYISILSPKEVSLDSRVRETVNRNMVEPSPHTFDDAQMQIYTLMHRDSYPRFVNSPMYKKLAQLNTSSRKESSANFIVKKRPGRQTKISLRVAIRSSLLDSSLFFHRYCSSLLLLVLLLKSFFFPSI